MIRSLRAILALVFTGAIALAVSGCATTGDGGDGSGVSSSRGSVVPGTGEESDERRRARIRLELGASYFEQGNYQVALDELGQALRIDPNYAPAYGVLGLVYWRLNDLPRAEDSFQRALRITPGDADLNNNFGWFLCQTGRERDSLARFERALQDGLYRTPAKALHNAGICSLRAGDEAAAERYLQQAFQIDAGNPVTMFNLGELYLRQNNLERARFFSQRLVTNFEPVAQTLWLALRVERASGNREAEASLATQLRRRFPDSPEAARLAAGQYGV